MVPGEVYQWKENFHETFQHLLVGSADTTTSFIQTIWINKTTTSSSSDCLLPNVVPAPTHQGRQGIRAEQFMYRTDYMIFMRMIDVQKDGFDSHGYGTPVPEADYRDDLEDVVAAEELINSNYRFQDFVSYFWFEFLLFSPDGQHCNLCTWIFLEQNENGVPSSPEKVFYKYFEKAFPSIEDE